MARKNALVRIDSEAVQGPGSYVTLRKPNWQVMRSIMKAQAQGADEASLGVEALETAIPAMIVDWNWAKEDGDGQEDPLPLPSKEPSVIEKLDFDEIMFLIKHVTPMLSSFGDARKN